MWVVLMDYDIEKYKTNIVRIESYEDFKKRDAAEKATLIPHVRIVSAVDALGAWKVAKEQYCERH